MFAEKYLTLFYLLKPQDYLIYHSGVTSYPVFKDYIMTKFDGLE
jgi:hypothetical protein